MAATTPAVQATVQAALAADAARDAVLRVARMLPDRPPVPVLAGIKISFLGDRVRFEAGNYEQAGYADAEATVAAAPPPPSTPAVPAAVLVPGALLARVIRRAPGADLTLTVLGQLLVLSAQRWTTRLLLMPVEDYPDWTGLYTGKAADDLDERIYGNSAETARPVPVDGFDRSLSRKPGPVPMWRAPAARREPYQPSPYEAGDWLEYTDAFGRRRIGQVWSSPTTHQPEILLVVDPDDGQQVHVREFHTYGGRRSKTRWSYHLSDERHFPGEDKPRTLQCQLTRTQAPDAPDRAPQPGGSTAVPAAA